MRGVSLLVAAAAALLCLGLGKAEAAFVGSPMGLRNMVERIRFETPTLPPMGYSQFCLRYAAECHSRMVFRGGPVKLTDSRLADLREVNKSINARIEPTEMNETAATERWLINPDRGDCNDYAVSKRHELLKRGWPARALLLSEVVTSWGAHHLVLVVRTQTGDMVLDNLTGQIRPWTRAPYRWVRIQMPNNSRVWASIADRRV